MNKNPAHVHHSLNVILEFHYPELKPIMKQLQLHAIMEATFEHSGSLSKEELRQAMIKVGFQPNTEIQKILDDEIT